MINSQTRMACSNVQRRERYTATDSVVYFFNVCKNKDYLPTVLRLWNHQTPFEMINQK